MGVWGKSVRRGKVCICVCVCVEGVLLLLLVGSFVAGEQSGCWVACVCKITNCIGV